MLGISWDLCPFLLASVQLSLAQVQGIRCLAADVGEMTLHKWLAFHFSHLIYCSCLIEIWRSLQINKWYVLLVVPINNFHFSVVTFILLNASPRLCWVDAHCWKKKWKHVCSLGSQKHSWRGTTDYWGEGKQKQRHNIIASCAEKESGSHVWYLMVIVVQLRLPDTCKHCCKYFACIDSYASHSIPER